MRFKPMLAEKYDAGRGFLFGETSYSQPKLDGWRVVASADGLFKRSGDRLTTAPHVEDALRPVFERRPRLLLDGELYRHDLAGNFGAIQSAAQKKGGRKLAFHAFDLFDPCRAFLDFSERLGELAEVLEPVEGMHVRTVETVECHRATDLDAAYAGYLAAGYEGQIVRLDRPYWQGRTTNLLKRKGFDDAEFRVVGIEAGSGEHARLAKVIVCALPATGGTFRAGLVAGHEAAERVLAERGRHVGRLATVRHLGTTAGGQPRHPNVVALHGGAGA